MDAQRFNYLLKRIKHDKNAAEEIYQVYFLKLKAYIRRCFGKLISPEDVSHDIFLKLLEIVPPDFVEYPTTWLYKLANNYVIDEVRKKRPEVELVEARLGEFDIEITIVNNDLKSALSQLDNVSQQIMYMHFWEGYQLKEIAKMLNLSYGNVRAKACRALKQLKNICNVYS